jgi:hypothetical protein
MLTFVECDIPPEVAVSVTVDVVVVVPGDFDP